MRRPVGRIFLRDGLLLIEIGLDSVRKNVKNILLEIPNL